jgi:hypothetical protein
VDQRDDEGGGDLADRLAGLHRLAQVGAGLLIGGGTGPVPVSGSVDGGCREAVLRRVVPGPGHQPGEPLVHVAATVADQDQRGRCGSRRPQDAGDLAEGEFAFEDAVVQALFGSESHGRAFRERPQNARQPSGSGRAADGASGPYGSRVKTNEPKSR